MSATLSPRLMEQFSHFVASRIGLDFPQDHWDELGTGLAEAAREEGAMDEEAYARRLLGGLPTRADIELLASHLTVGETYFFREKSSFEALERRVLPELIGDRRNSGMKIRIWSAACCTGEEAYSIAIVLDKLIPDIADWKITVLATDINPRFLEKAQAGVYREWSFRAIPSGIREGYFSPVDNGELRIAERIRGMVTFAPLNLAEDVFPSKASNTEAMDLVLCRNVLMYFTPQTVARVVASFHEALAEDGWLLVAPSEASQCLYNQFTPIAFPEATFYRKSLALPIPPRPAPTHSVTLPRRAKSVTDKVVPPSSLRRPIAEIAAPYLIAKAFADKGELTEALSWCDRAIASDPLNPAPRYLRAMVAQELGRLDEAMEFLGQALYLDADFIMAHYALGNLAEKLGRREEAARHFRNALALLLGRSNEEPMPEAGGITAGRLTELIRSVEERVR